jgi:phosphatidylserine decarboxylase
MKDALFILMQHLLPQRLVTWLAGRLAGCRLGLVKTPFISWFIRRYKVDMAQALEPDPMAYADFNAFFTRALKPGIRPMPDDQSCIVSPADGTISQLGPINDGQLLQAKGRTFSVQALLGGEAGMAETFQGGSFVTVYLSPRDYHRLHMPLGGTLKKMLYVPGKFFSVNQLTSERVDNLFARNERVVCLFDTDAGPMAMVLVGAMIVGSIDTVWAGQVAPPDGAATHINYQQHLPAIQIARGEEMGRFKLGSTVIVLFGPGMAELDAELQAGDAILMGEAMGTSNTATVAQAGTNG